MEAGLRKLEVARDGRDARIEYLERRLEERDLLIRQLRAELDKCQQVLSAPPNGSSLDRATAGARLDAMAQLAPWRLAAAVDASSVEQRLKRMGISAEPRPKMSLADLKKVSFNKVAKSSK